MVLHVISDDRGFLCWAEDQGAAEAMAGELTNSMSLGDAESEDGDNDSDGGVQVKREMSTAVAETSAHPYAVTAGEISGLVQSILGDAEPPRVLDDLDLTMPHRIDAETIPAPSLSLSTNLGLNTLDPEDLLFRPTRVPAVSLRPKQALDLLLRLRDRPIEGVACGHDLVFWAEVAAFSLELLSDQRFVPSVFQREGDHLEARWVPWLADNGLSEPLQHLARWMPTSAVSMTGVTTLDRWMEIERGLEKFIDASIRDVLVREEFIDAIEDRDDESDRQVTWLSGLLGKAREISGSNEQAVDVMRGARQWLSGLIDPSEGRSVRLCLQLSEPLEGILDASEAELADATWPLSFHLVVTDDPPIIIDAAQIWSDGGGGRLASVLGPDETPGDILLGELARAERIWPRLQESLEDIDPTGLDLETAEAHAFLQDIRPILQESGVEVLVPSWWGQAASRIGVRLIVGPNGEQEAAPGMGLSSLVDYAWEISIGDESVGLEELRRLAEQGVPLVRIGDQWVEIRREDFDKATRFLEKHPGGESTLGEVLRLASGGEDEDDAPRISGIRTSGWVKELLGDEQESTDDAVRPIEVPEKFQGKLRPYQERGLAWLAFLDRFGLGGCLADDMGLGKTIQMIALLQHERTERAPELIHPTLMVCPMSVAGNWRRELERFAPELRVHVQHGPDRPVGDAFTEIASNSDVVVTTYALVSRDRNWIENVEWERVVLDEAQHIKNPPTKQATAIRSIKSRHRVALTGTPVENRLTELWSIMEFCLPGFLGPQGEFRRRFAIPIERHRDERRGERLKRLVGPFVLRRLKTDDGVADDLPPLLESRQHVPLTPEQARLYDTVVQDMLRQVDEATGIRRRGLVLSGLVRLKQICNHPAHYLKEVDSAPTGDRLSQRSGKSMRLVELLEEVIASGDRALLFTQFRQMGHLLSTIVRQEFDLEPLFLHGGTPQGRREQMIERFQSGDSPPIFILSLKAGGVGVNLTSANHVIHYDRWWNPAVENQATDRAFRIGQTRTVNVHKMITTGTLEERIDQMIEQKTELARRIIGTGESWLTELDSEKLREVLSLRETSIEEEMS